MQEKEMKFFNHEQMQLGCVQTEKGLQQTIFHASREHVDPVGFGSSPSLQIGLVGVPYGGNDGANGSYSSVAAEMKVTEVEQTDDKIVFRYTHETRKLSACVEMEKIPGVSIFRILTTITNMGERPITLTHLSSAFMQGIGLDGIRPWYDSNKMKFYYCRQTWEGEGQWRSGDLEELGLYPVAVHPNYSGIQFHNVGSWSTSKFVPMGILEDRETGQVWYFQIETSASWHFSVGVKGSTISETGKGSLYIHTDAADERYGGWIKNLQPGESYTSVPTAVGCCKGGFEEAIHELTIYRRKRLKPANAWQDEFPVVFNDYMNCLWADPSEEGLLPVIEAAAKAGAECFCIDAGWFGDRGVNWGMGLGDWQPSKDRFGKAGLKGILDTIRKKGMIPGIWMEMEVCGETAELVNKPDAWFLMRNGARVGGGARYFLNFTNAEVRRYLHNVFDRLAAMGIGFIKNDYNACIGAGDDVLGDSSAEGLLKNTAAFYSFIDEVRGTHPGLIIENCGSGAMRQDYGVLSHFHIQSTSDQEIYTNFPSIISGALATLLPEQAGFWAYPMPLLFEHRNNEAILKDEAWQQSFADGEQTIFNMVNGMCGILYLSGRLDAADDKNMRLVQEAVALYKKERDHIRASHAIWPLGFCHINRKETWAAIGLLNEQENRLLLAVWRLETNQEFCEIPLDRFAGKNARVRQLYPSVGEYRTEFHFDQEKGHLTVKLKGKNQARYFETSC